jgi:cyclopropane fatty-acyl-phospholipid synthase-like methyltransferase
MMAERVAGRLLWAMETLDFGPDDRLLEIGCGAGIAVEMVCERLAGGRIHAIDRSESMAALARRRNAGHVAAEKVVIQNAALHQADFGGERFDRIFAINVGLFREHRAEEAAALRGLLAPGGALCLFHHPPVASKTRRLAEETAAVLRDEGFAVRAIRYDDREAVPMACVIAGGP